MPRQSKGLVLIIDDNPGVLDSLKLALETYGFDVATAGDGTRGFEMLHSISPAIVVTDILMPNRDGIEMILQIRRERPEIKIVGMSGGGRIGNTDYLDVATKLGADAVLEKPFDPSALADVLNQLIEARI